jgi:hypothetical protein
VNGFCYALRLIPVNCIGPARGYRTKTAAAGTYITKDHKGCGAFAPAFAHIRTITAFANGMQFMLIYQIAHMTVIFTGWQFYTEPVRLLNNRG